MRQLLEYLLLENEKEDWFEQRTNNHIKLVQKAAKKIVEKYPEFKNLIEEVKDHDASKLVEPERTPYIELTWQHKTNGRKYETPGTIKEKEINDATMHHILNNNHHPEFWNKEEVSLDPNNRDKNIKCIDVSKMPDLMIAEMCCDWFSMGIELGNNSLDWFKKTKDVRWHWSPHQEELIVKLLSFLEESK